MRRRGPRDDVRRPRANRAQQLERLRFARIFSRGERQRVALTFGVPGATEQHGQTHMQRRGVGALLAIEQRTQRDRRERWLAETREPPGQLFAKHRIFTQ